MKNEVEAELIEYESSKRVHATPMSDIQYYNYYHDHSPEQQKKMALPKYLAASPMAKPGYLVVYRKGEDVEYRSWSPKDFFEEASKPVL